MESLRPSGGEVSLRDLSSSQSQCRGRCDWDKVYSFSVADDDEEVTDTAGVVMNDDEGSTTTQQKKLSLGMAFTRRLNTLRREARHLQYLFAVTSTLGGANHLCNQPIKALMYAKNQEYVGRRLNSTTMIVRSRVFQGVNFAILGDIKLANKTFRDCYRMAQESQDQGIIDFTLAVHSWLKKEIATAALEARELRTEGEGASMINNGNNNRQGDFNLTFRV